MTKILAPLEAIVLFLMLATCPWTADCCLAQPVTQQPLWQPPTSGPPVEINFLPQGVQAIVAWRAAEFMADPEADKVLAALGPLGKWISTTLPGQTGLPLEKCQHILLGLLAADGQLPPYCVVIEATEPLDEAAVAKHWNAQLRPIDRQRVFVAGEMAFCVPDQPAGSLLLMGPLSEMPAMLRQRNEPSQLARELEELLARSDAQLHWNILSSPDYWVTSGRELFGQSSNSVRHWLGWFFGRSARASLFAAHLDDHLYLDLRVAISSDEPPQIAARRLRQNVSELPGRVQNTLSDELLSDYNRAVLTQMPAMLKAGDQFTRLGVEGRQIILRAYLPVAAAHNLALATRLYFETIPARVLPAAGATAPTATGNTLD